MNKHIPIPINKIPIRPKESIVENPMVCINFSKNTQPNISYKQPTPARTNRRAATIVNAIFNTFFILPH